MSAIITPIFVIQVTIRNKFFSMIFMIMPNQSIISTALKRMLSGIMTACLQKQKPSRKTAWWLWFSAPPPPFWLMIWPKPAIRLWISATLAKLMTGSSVKKPSLSANFLLLRDRLHTFDTNAVKTYDLLCHRAKRSFNRVNKRQEVLILRFS